MLYHLVPNAPRITTIKKSDPEIVIMVFSFRLIAIAGLIIVPASLEVLKHDPLRLPSTGGTASELRKLEGYLEDYPSLDFSPNRSIHSLRNYTAALNPSAPTRNMAQSAGNAF